MYIPRTIHLASAALPAAGAFTSQDFFDLPIGIESLIYYITYTRGAVGGRPLFRTEWGNVLTDPGGGEETRDIIIDGATGITIATPNARFDFLQSEPRGPIPADGAAIDYILRCGNITGGYRKTRLLMAEIGVAATPGTAQITLTAS